MAKSHPFYITESKDLKNFHVGPLLTKICTLHSFVSLGVLGEYTKSQLVSKRFPTVPLQVNGNKLLCERKK
jgi:hypothetical protein